MATNQDEVSAEELDSIDNGILIEDFPTPRISINEEVLNNYKKHNASIIIGRDRPGGLGSGYGRFSKKQGGDKCTTMDIVVGRYSFQSGKESVSTTGEKVIFGAEEIVGNHFQNDASRIYISQKTNIDEHFIISEAGTLSPSIGKAAIGIKSDNIRIVGRETVKIVAKTGEANSLGRIDSSVDDKENLYGIQLVTGCVTEEGEVQGIVKATNLQECLTDLISKLDTLIGSFHGFVQFQSTFNTYVSSHEHSGHFRSDIAGAVSILAPFDLIKAYSKYNNDITSGTLKDIDSLRQSLKVLTSNFLTPRNKKYIGSFYNKTN